MRVQVGGLVVGFQTDHGKRRAENEDSVGVFPIGDATSDLAILVADGVGGRNAGRIASSLAVEIVKTTLASVDVRAETESLGLAWRDRAEETLRRSAQGVHEELLRQMSDRPMLAGMATTLALAAFMGDHLMVLHSGDSRVYLLRAGTLYQLTSDHTWAAQQRLARTRPETEIQAASHKDQLVQIAGGAAFQPSVSWVKLQRRDRVVVASDGLTRYVDGAALAADLGQELPAEQVVGQLVKKALDSGGVDNITVAVADVVGDRRSMPTPKDAASVSDAGLSTRKRFTARPAKGPRSRRVSSSALGVMALGIGLLVAAGVSVASWANQSGEEGGAGEVGITVREVTDDGVASAEATVTGTPTNDTGAGSVASNPARTFATAGSATEGSLEVEIHTETRADSVTVVQVSVNPPRAANSFRVERTVGGQRTEISALQAAGPQVLFDTLKNPGSTVSYEAISRNVRERSFASTTITIPPVPRRADPVIASAPRATSVPPGDPVPPEDAATDADFTVEAEAAPDVGPPLPSPETMILAATVNGGVVEFTASEGDDYVSGLAWNLWRTDAETEDWQALPGYYGNVGDLVPDEPGAGLYRYQIRHAASDDAPLSAPIEVAIYEPEPPLIDEYDVYVRVVRLTWRPSLSTGNPIWRIQRRSRRESAWNVLDSAIVENGYTDPQVEKGVTYDYRVDVTQGSARSGWSRIIQIPVPPSTPRGVRTYLERGRRVLEWEPPSVDDGATHLVYRLVRLDGGDGTLVGPEENLILAEEGRRDVRGVCRGVEYELRVWARAENTARSAVVPLTFTSERNIGC